MLVNAGKGRLERTHGKYPSLIRLLVPPMLLPRSYYPSGTYFHLFLITINPKSVWITSTSVRYVNNGMPASWEHRSGRVRLKTPRSLLEVRNKVCVDVCCIIVIVIALHISVPVDVYFVLTISSLFSPNWSIATSKPYAVAF